MPHYTVTILSLAAAGARGVYTGTIHDHAGRLGATFFQETLLRPWR
jgi:hypothetical protein